MCVPGLPRVSGSQGNVVFQKNEFILWFKKFGRKILSWHGVVFLPEWVYLSLFFGRFTMSG